MKIKFQGDYDLKRAIISGVKRRQPEIDFQNADDAQLRGIKDEDVLAVAASDVSWFHTTAVQCLFISRISLQQSRVPG
jgi:hypothetical protein